MSDAPAGPERFDPSVTSAARKADLGIDLLLLRRIARFFVPFWSRRAAWPYWIAMAFLLAQTALGTTLSLTGSYILKDMTNALTIRDGAQFQWQFLLYATVFLAEFLLTGLAMIASGWIVKGWRIWLTDRIAGRYLAGRAYYDIAQRGELDNPDQRIQESLSTLVVQFCGVPVNVLGSLGALLAGGAVLQSIDGRLAPVVIGTTALQAVATYLGFVPLVRLRYAVAMANGNLRYALTHVHVNAEAIAFYEGEAVETVRLRGLVAAAVRRDLIETLFRRGVTDVAPIVFEVLWIVLPYLVLAPRLFAGEIDFGTVVQGISVSAGVSTAATLLFGLLTPITVLAPHAVRVAQIVERVDALDAETADGTGRRITIEHRSGSVAVHELSLETPGGEQRLVRNLNFVMEKGQNLVIVGQTGVGKSSLLRAIAGLWTRGEGRVVMPPQVECLFLPQRPYMTRADLRSQLLYPHGGACPDAVLLDALTAVRLPNLAMHHGGLSAIKDWEHVLSLGEQQRLAFARVLIAQPRLVLLDEATSAVDGPTEAHLYHVLAATGASFISVGHRDGILEHHTFMLTLMPGGDWTLTSLEAGASRA